VPVTFSIQPIIDAQTTALTTTINAARDNVKADNTTQITSQNTALTTAINAARDNVKADNVTQVTAQTTAINGNTDTKTAAVTTAVGAKGAVKSIQRGTATPNSGTNSTLGTLSVTVAAVDVAKSVLLISGMTAGSIGDYTVNAGKLLSATQIEFRGWRYSQGALQSIEWQLVEYF
jgi:hypothetical protein